MSVRITETEMMSTVTEHRAIATSDGWTVTLIPFVYFDRNSAITAMSLAEIYATNPPADSALWVHARDWERELGIDGGDH
ncbi:hypothetical protein BS329_32865 [Amycolatopsis coloradensis]|uniref:Uncharacterized protein n=1 Tax=Amycolatopsis coloradensis TaxID=76021 RepID=A0A1R0KHL4_9PSEU|nr:hypothetical protein [Amycolatopsis coloradensis]OLZ45238.1 hypothetical protein BS329_32865 [Amycolatopsis coloradensis]